MGLDNDDIKALIAILQKGLSGDDNDEAVTSKRKSQRSSKPRQTKKKSTNKFDNMPEFGMCKEDVEIDRKIKKPPPSLRNRPFEPIKVQCRVCGKKR